MEFFFFFKERAIKDGDKPVSSKAIRKVHWRKKEGLKFIKKNITSTVTDKNGKSIHCFLLIAL